MVRLQVIDRIRKDGLERCRNKFWVYCFCGFMEEVTREQYKHGMILVIILCLRSYAIMKVGPFLWSWWPGVLLQRIPNHWCTDLGEMHTIIAILSYAGLPNYYLYELVLWPKNNHATQWCFQPLFMIRPLQQWTVWPLDHFLRFLSLWQYPHYGSNVIIPKGGYLYISHHHHLVQTGQNLLDTRQMVQPKRHQHRWTEA